MISSRIGFVALVLGLLSALVPIGGTMANIMPTAVLFVAFFLFCRACFANPGGWLARWFSWTLLRWLGNMSYSYYLIHGLTLKGAFLVMGKLFPASAYGSGILFFVLLVPMFALTLTTSAVLFLVVERPFSLVPRRALPGASRQAMP